MTDIVTKQPPGPGEAFMTGVGAVGALLYQFARFIGPMRLDDQRWTCNRIVYADPIIQRLIEAGWCEIGPEKFNDRELIELTEKGWSELLNFCLKRSLSLAEIDTPKVSASISPDDTPPSASSLAFDLATFGFEQGHHRAGTLPARYLASVLVKPAEGEPIDLYSYLEGPKDGEPPWRRMERVFNLIADFADASMHGVPIAEMDLFAAWCAAVAAEAFRRAPDQNWETDGEAE